jgi:Amt family ammonium transporter
MEANATFPKYCEISAGDTSWVMISTVLVLGMVPALAFFEAGLLR